MRNKYKVVVILALSLFFNTNAYSAIFKCKVHGKISYSDKPCPENSTQANKVDELKVKPTNPKKIDSDLQLQDLKFKQQINSEFSNNKDINKTSNKQPSDTTKNKQNTNTKNTADDKPIHIAARNGDFEKVKLLLNARTIKQKNIHKATALHVASHAGHADIVSLLISKGANIKERNRWDASPLRLAASQGHFLIVRILVENGADINEYSKRYGSLMFSALRNPEVAHYLLDKGVDVNLKPKVSGSILLRRPIPIDLYTRLAKKVNDINDYFPDMRESTPIMYASYKGEMEKVKLLISLGADIQIKGRSGSSALLLASEGGHSDVIELLMQHGADINHIDDYGRTALILASRNGKYEAVKALLKYNPDLDVRTDKGVKTQEIKRGVSIFPRSAIDWAELNNNPDIVALLKKAGAK